ncbi:MULTISPECIES: cupin domain-containing protein [unclassified Streptomyces]|uniref:cupin domain-containing protein n=1 Tax=unclassified Streptomyces TaxID=2593676 RepID=UPI002E15BEB6|nr:cupin domain-containing protein [Streptomyces sp. NBC_01186]WSS42395.1 cupin domain-containing protein [Streptomyces sp. NBC_01187]
MPHDASTTTPQALVDHFGLEPLPQEGGRFRQLWAGPDRGDGRPEGTSIVVLLTSEPGDRSRLHRLSADEIWHHYLGDPLTLLLLAPDGSARTPVLGPDVLGAGHHVQLTVPAGTWIGARVAEGGSWTLFGCTMAPGYTEDCYEHGDPAALARAYPRAAREIEELGRP